MQVAHICLERPGPSYEYLFLQDSFLGAIESTPKCADPGTRVRSLLSDASGCNCMMKDALTHLPPPGGSKFFCYVRWFEAINGDPYFMRVFVDKESFLSSLDDWIWS